MLNFLNEFISETFCLLGLIRDKAMVLGLPRPSLCAWFSLARLPTEAARKLFLYHFLKEKALSFIFLLIEPVQCFGKTFLYLIFCPVT